MVRKVADNSRVTERLLENREAILGEPDRHVASYLHVVLAQCGLPYREPPEGTRDYHRTNGLASLVVTSGHLMDPISRVPVLQGLPYGTKPRLLLIHLCTEAVRTKSPVVPVKDSLTAFMKAMGFQVTGGKKGSLTQFKEQLNRLAAAHIQIFMNFGDHASNVNAQPIRQYDVWFPDSPDQQILWPESVTLHSDFYESLREHALPLEVRAVRSLQNSARALDIYFWLTYRLPRVKDPAGEPLSWHVLQTQFGSGMEDWRDFKKDFTTALKKALAVYPDARVEPEYGGIRIFQSRPAVPYR